MNKQRLKELRNDFRKSVFQRDGLKCVMCGLKAVDAHHITDRHEMPNGGYVKNNGISLCEKCHWNAEQFHINEGKLYIHGYHPDDLYKKICSSKEQAIADCPKI